MCKIYMIQQLSHKLYKLGVPVLPKLIYYFLRFTFTTSVPWTVTVGRGTRFNNYGMGIVVHRRVAIGENCMIGQHVTIGGRSGHEEVPVIGNNVFVGVGAKVLGPIKVGDHAVIGANAVVIHDVPSRAVVAGIPARIIKSKSAVAKMPQHGV